MSGLEARGPRNASVSDADRGSTAPKRAQIGCGRDAECSAPESKGGHGGL